MGDLGLVFALVTAAYIVGVWTGGLVFSQRQSAYEEAVVDENSSRTIVGADNRLSRVNRR
jgi:hypothetical protein